MFSCFVLIGAMLLFFSLSHRAPVLKGYWDCWAPSTHHNRDAAAPRLHREPLEHLHLHLHLLSSWNVAQAEEAAVPNQPFSPAPSLLSSYCLAPPRSSFSAHTHNCKCTHLYMKTHTHSPPQRRSHRLWWTNVEVERRTSAEKTFLFPSCSKKKKKVPESWGSEGKVLAFYYFQRISTFVCRERDLGQRHWWFLSFMYPLLTGEQPGNNQSPFFFNFLFWPT